METDPSANFRMGRRPIAIPRGAIFHAQLTCPSATVFPPERHT